MSVLKGALRDLAGGAGVISEVMETEMAENTSSQVLYRGVAGFLPRATFQQLCSHDKIFSIFESLVYAIKLG